ncbi:MAG: hypothetical protein ACKVW3_18020 [Phycisphaerales bacterium]
MAIGKQAGRSGRASVVAAAMGVASASAQPLTTTFAGGGQAAGMMFDLRISAPEITIQHFEVAMNMPSGTAFSYAVWSREGTHVGHESSAQGWVLRLQTTFGGVGSGGLAFIGMGTGPVVSGQVLGVFIEITQSPASEPLVYTPIPPALPTYSNSLVTLSGGVAKGPGGFSGATTPNSMVNATVRVGTCYVNCTQGTVVPYLNVGDFVCFNNRYVSDLERPVALHVSAYSNCDRSTVPPVLSVNDFICFMNKFAAGCSAP